MTLRIIPADRPDEPYRAPDLVWDGLTGDLAINGPDHPVAPGDLRAEQGLATQVLICLMTDVAVPRDALEAGEDNRGWPGDSFDLEAGETPLGSTLWRFRRQALLPGIETQIADAARLALRPLIEQRVAVRAEVSAIADRAANRVDLDVALYGRDGGQTYHIRFEDLWRQLDGLDHPLAQ